MKDILPFLIDTHVHLDASPLAEAIEDEVRQARLEGVRGFVIPGVDRQGWRRLPEIAQAVSGAWAAPGLHPLAAGEWNGEAQRELGRLLAEPSVVAIGEIGLDTLIAQPSLELQEKAFRAQLRLAIEADRPVLIHCRRAAGRLLEILREEKAERIGGIFHAFSGSAETAMEGIKLGFAIGIGGTVTYPNARRAIEVVKEVSAEWLVLETDAPDLAPHPHRGEANRPAWLPLIAQKVADIRGWSLEETARVTTQNAKRVLKIS